MAPQHGHERAAEGRRLRSQRNRLRLSQRDVALAMGVSPATVGNIEAGVFSQRMRNRLADALALLAKTTAGAR
jgi:transcriptional regulator with XRE-family HTH domain